VVRVDARPLTLQEVLWSYALLILPSAHLGAAGLIVESIDFCVAPSGLSSQAELTALGH